MTAWASSTLAHVDFETGRIDDRFHLRAIARINYGPAMTDTQLLTDAQLGAELKPSLQTMDSEKSAIDMAGGRKFALAVLSLVLATVLAWFGKVPAEAWMWVSITAMTGYAGLNVAQKVLAK